MDNFSHALVGLAVGELVHRSLKTEADSAAQSTRRRLLLSAGALASNFPDLDLVLTPLLPSPLGYLLHHRGHTHTLLYALPQAMLLIALLWALWPSARALLRTSTAARRGLLLAVGAGFVLHMSMDFLNSYGVHPFHPFDSRWLYGDMVFILEPVFWVACAAPLAMLVRRTWLRIAFGGVLACALLFFTYSGFLHWGSLAGLALLGAALAWMQARAGSLGRRGLAAGLLAGVAFAGLQGLASQHGKGVIAAHLHGIDPASQVADIAMSPFPSNPLCWSFVSVERNQAAGSYRLRRGSFGLAPALLPIAHCPPAMAARAEPLPAMQAGAQVALQWEALASLAALRQLNADSCQFSAWLRFARVPALREHSASDVRFGLGDDDNFSTLPYARFAGQPCDSAIPQWDKPRQDLLTP